MSQYIIINKQKYNIDKWKSFHPGGNVFTEFIGQDCTAIFYAYHNANDLKIKSLLSKLIISSEDIEEHSLSPIDKDYIMLHDTFINLKLYTISESYYFKKILLLSLLFISSLYLQGKLDLIAGCMFGLLIQQSAFIGHDIGHNSVLKKTTGIFNEKYKYIWAFIFGNVLFGVDGLNWSNNHNIHHFTSCVPSKDPQNDHLPFVLYKKRELDITGYKLSWLFKLMLQIQWLYILPLLFTIGKINIIFDIDNRTLIYNRNYIRIIGIFLHIGLWGCFINNTTNYYLFIIGALFFNGMIHLQIILSHAFMPRTTMDEVYSEGWVVSQAKTTVNLTTSWYDEWFHGGLQYQYDHHLFPRIPRHNLKYIQPHIMGFCKKHNIPYNTMTFMEAIIELIKSLYREARLIDRLIVQQ